MVRTSLTRSIVWTEKRVASLIQETKTTRPASDGSKPLSFAPFNYEREKRVVLRNTRVLAYFFIFNLILFF